MTTTTKEEALTSTVPNKWIAAILGLFLQGFALLYVAQPAWTIFYFIVSLAIAIARISLSAAGGQGLLFDLVAVMLAIVAAVHAYRIASKWPQDKQRPAYSRWYGLLGIVAVFSMALICLRAFVAEPFRIPAASMKPALPVGSTIVIEKWGYGHYSTFGISLLRTAPTARIALGDIIVFDYPENPEVNFVKRVVGLPGDKVSYRERRLSVNGLAAALEPTTNVPAPALNEGQRFVEEKLGGESYTTIVDDNAPPIRLNAVRKFPDRSSCTYDDSGVECVVPPGKYFVMGDNRDNSDDSRYWGFVPESAVVGKLKLVFRPS